MKPGFALRVVALALATSWLSRAAEPPPVPKTHPRLYLRAEHAKALPARLKDPALQPVVKRLQAMAERSPQYRVEWLALQCLANGAKEEEARPIIVETLDFLKKAELPKRLDGCRYTGRVMVTGAMIYDWLYSSLTAEEKKAFIAEFVRLAKTLECGYPPIYQGSVTGHSSEAMIMRDMLSAGIAIHDETPEMYDLAARRFFREHLPARNWFYNGHAYHQGDSYGPYRYTWDTFPLFIFDRLGAGNVYNPEQRFVPYLWLYTTRPDGQRLRAGDTFRDTGTAGEPWKEPYGMLFTASYYRDSYLLGHWLKQPGVNDTESIFEFLWRDTTLQPAPVDSLPLSRYCESPFGWMVARTGWGDDAAIAEFKVNEYNFDNHQHLDAGAFQIYYRGSLAIDSGSYAGSSGDYGSPHCRNYYWRTIAHNSLLVFDPMEKFDRRGEYVNDGGQRLPNGRSEPRTLEALRAPENGYRTGKVLAHGFGPDTQTPEFTLLQGDITDAYSRKVKSAIRSFVFLNLHDKAVPSATIVYDRVVSAASDFRKTWLLHTLEEPQIDGRSARVDGTERGGSGRLEMDVLLPSGDNASLVKIGGPGREFWVNGTNYANDIAPARRARATHEPGAWRIELSPQKHAEEDAFLVVMQTTDRTAPAHRRVQRIQDGRRIGCVLDCEDAQRVVVFDQSSEPAAGPVAFAIAGARPCKFLVTDLRPGRWTATRDGGVETVAVDVAADLRAAWFTGRAGTWKLVPAP